MGVITQENLFQWNVEQVLSRIENDYSKQIMYSFENGLCQTFKDWLNLNPKILGEYMCEQLNSNFDFEEFNNLNKLTTMEKHSDKVISEFKDKVSWDTISHLQRYNDEYFF